MAHSECQHANIPAEPLPRSEIPNAICACTIYGKEKSEGSHEGSR
jgi:hypothetical protein